MEMTTPILDQSKLLRVAICFWTMMCVVGCLYIYVCLCVVNMFVFLCINCCISCKLCMYAMMRACTPISCTSSYSEK